MLSLFRMSKHCIDIPIGNTLDLTLVIPTYNRAEILEKSLLKYNRVQGIEQVQVLVINNGSSDNTEEVVKRIIKTSSLNLSYVVETRVGLSYARNKVLESSTTEYVLYLDDDCFPCENFVKNAKKWLDYNEIVVTGKCERWEELTPEWIDDQFFINNPTTTSINLLTSSEFIKGGVLLTTMEVLKKTGGFEVSLGMNGDKVYYGEDTKFGNDALALKIPVYFDPGLVIYHKSHFTTPSEFLRSQFQKGVSYWNISPDKESVLRVTGRLIKISLQSSLSFLYHLIGGVDIKKNIVMNFSKVANVYGQWYSALSS